MKYFNLIFLILFSQSIWAQHPTADLDSLNQKIRDAGADWVAGDTGVNQLSSEDMKALVGLDRDIHPEVQFEVPEQASTFAQTRAETTIDWRSRNGKNWVTPIKDQSTCGSCVAFASVGTLEVQYQIANNNPNSHIKLSPAFLFSCGGGRCNRGWWPTGAAQFLQTKGTPDESCMPYRPTDMACNSACSNAASRSQRIATYSTPTTGTRDISAIKAALKDGPLVTTLNAYDDFMDYHSGVYKHVSGGLVGGHAVSIIGYDDNRRAFLIRNSWATSWGDRGFAYISYDDTSGLGNFTWHFGVAAKTFTLDSLNLRAPASESNPETANNETMPFPTSTDADPRLTLQPIADHYLLQASSTEAFAKVEFHRRSEKGREKVIEFSLKSLETIVKMNKENLSHGHWDIYFVGYTAQGERVESEHQSLEVK